MSHQPGGIPPMQPEKNSRVSKIFLIIAGVLLFFCGGGVLSEMAGGDIDNIQRPKVEHVKLTECKADRGT